jgi:lipopolysaccharide transport system permease protein
VVSATARVAAEQPSAEGFDLQGESTSVADLVRRTVGSRRLLLMLARKDFFVRYRRASFGLMWAVVLPLFQAVVLALVFSHIARIQAGGNYPTFVYSGILPWIFFSGSLPGAVGSIVDGQDIATKIYFPRVILPMVTVGANLYGFGPGLVILFGFALIGHVQFGLNWVLLVPATILMVLLTTSLCVVLAALQVYFRDLRYVVAAALTAWIYVSPVLYPIKLAPHLLRSIMEVVPTTGMVELFRAASVGPDPGWHTSLYCTLGWTGALLAAALLLYQRFDRVFVDLL